MSSGSATPEDAPLLLDVMLGKLATYLRMCGYDAAYALDREPRTPQNRTSTEGQSGGGRSGDSRGIEGDDALLELAREEGRLLVTRDVELARRAGGLLIESLDVTEQLREVAAAGFALALSEPTRCAECNGALREVTDDVESTPEYAPASEEFRVWRCTECGQYFWMGSHWESVEETLSEL